MAYPWTTIVTLSPVRVRMACLDPIAPTGPRVHRAVPVYPCEVEFRVSRPDDRVGLAVPMTTVTTPSVAAHATLQRVLEEPVTLRLVLAQSPNGDVRGLLFAWHETTLPLGLVLRPVAERLFPADLGAEGEDLLASLTGVPVADERTAVIARLLEEIRPAQVPSAPCP
jgi:hypothetical protein